MTTVIIVAGGPTNSTRMGKAVNKCFLSLQGQPIILFSLKTFSQIPQLDRIIISLCENDQPKLQPLTQSPIVFCNAGATRMQSIGQALTQFEFDPEELVLIHDAARPFVTQEMISQLISVIQNPNIDAAVVGGAT